MDCGLILTKPGVSLEKELGRTGTFGSRPSDWDLAAQIKKVRDLIVAVGYGSGG